MADPDGPRHGVGVTVEKAACGVGITDVNLIVAAKDVNHYEFSVLSRFDLTADALLIESGASRWEVRWD